MTMSLRHIDTTDSKIVLQHEWNSNIMSHYTSSPTKRIGLFNGRFPQLHSFFQVVSLFLTIFQLIMNPCWWVGNVFAVIL